MSNFKYTLFIDQRECLRLGITNINQAIIFDLLAHADSWSERITHEDKHYNWVARQAIAKQLPILNLKPDTIYRHLKSLAELGVIEHVKVGVKDCVRMTKIGKSYYVGNKSESRQNSEVNPTKLGNDSKNNSEMNPTYKTTIINKTTKDKKDIAPTAKSKKFIKPTIQEIKEYCIERKNTVNAEQFFDYNQSKGWLVGKTPMKDWEAAVRTWERNGFNNKPHIDPNETLEQCNDRLNATAKDYADQIRNINFFGDSE